MAPTIEQTIVLVTITTTCDVSCTEWQKCGLNFTIFKVILRYQATFIGFQSNISFYYIYLSDRANLRAVKEEWEFVTVIMNFDSAPGDVHEANVGRPGSK